MGYFDRLKVKWGISSNRQLWIIFIVFGLTGSSSVKVARPFLEYIGLTPTAFADFPLGGMVYWILRILAIFPSTKYCCCALVHSSFNSTSFGNLKRKYSVEWGLNDFFRSLSLSWL